MGSSVFFLWSPLILQRTPVLMDLSVSRKYRIAFITRFFMKCNSLFSLPSPSLAFQMEKGKERQLSLPWESGLEGQREGVETASWLGQEAPSRLGQRQALG